MLEKTPIPPSVPPENHVTPPPPPQVMNNHSFNLVAVVLKMSGVEMSLTSAFTSLYC